MQIVKGHTRDSKTAKNYGAVTSAFVLAACAVVWSASKASGQIADSAKGGNIQPGNAAEVTAAALSGEVKTSQVIRDPGAPYENPFQNFNVGLKGQPKVGAGHAYINVGPANLGALAASPIDRGFRPEDANLKIGNFYLSLNYLTASFIYSDNVNLTENNRDDGVASAVTLGMTGLYQINDGLRVSVSGAAIWLPFKNKVGVSGFGLLDPFAYFALDNQALFSAGVKYDAEIAGWNVIVYDDFRIINRTLYRLGDAGNVDFYDGETFNEQSDFRRQRLYTVQGATGATSNLPTQSTDSFNLQALTYINAAGAAFNRVLPSDLSTTFGYTHFNYWYSGVAKSPLGVYANSREFAFAGVESVRENLRFKPYAYYTARTSDVQQGWDHTVTGGLHGPITDYIEFDGSAGYVFADDSPTTSLIWQIQLKHTINPTTYHSVYYRRLLTEPDRLLRESLGYTLQKILGPYLRSGLFAQHSIFSDLKTNTTQLTEDQAGAFVNYDLAEHGQLSFQLFYSSYDFQASIAASDYDLWTARAVYSCQLTPTVFGDFLYQFQQRDSAAPGNSYYENLFAVRLIKKF